jgi:hypothetical protein
MSNLNLVLLFALLTTSALAPIGAKALPLAGSYINDTGKPQTDFHFTVIVGTGGNGFSPPESDPWGLGTATEDPSVPGGTRFDVEYHGDEIPDGGLLSFPELPGSINNHYFFDDFVWTPSGKEAHPPPKPPGTVSAVPAPSALPLFGTAIAGLAAIRWNRTRRKLA